MQVTRTSLRRRFLRRFGDRFDGDFFDTLTLQCVGGCGKNLEPDESFIILEGLDEKQREQRVVPVRHPFPCCCRADSDLSVVQVAKRVRLFYKELVAPPDPTRRRRNKKKAARCKDTLAVNRLPRTVTRSRRRRRVLTVVSVSSNGNGDGHVATSRRQLVRAR